MKINSPLKSDYELLNRVGIAIQAINDTPGDCHIGILYKTNENIRLLHYTATIIEEISPKKIFLWLDLGDFFDDEEREYIKSKIQLIAKTNNKKPASYGYTQPYGHINKLTGKLEPVFGEIGLTCASFVLEVFDACGYKLVDTDTWPTDIKENTIWQAEMLNLIARHYEKKQGDEGKAQKILEQSKSIGNARYLPTEVAASSQLEPPAPHTELETLSEQLRDAATKLLLTPETTPIDA